jgi:uncharacterized protein
MNPALQVRIWAYWLAMAGDQGAAENRDIVAGLMTPAQIAEAQKLAREWQSKGRDLSAAGES